MVVVKLFFDPLSHIIINSVLLKWQKEAATDIDLGEIFGLMSSVWIYALYAISLFLDLFFE